MATSVLQEFLHSGLIQGLDEPEYERLTKASARIKKRLASDLMLMRRYCVAMLDENLPDNDPSLDEIQNDVEEEWKTFAGKFTARQVAMLRAVGVQALVDVAKEDANAGRILWFTGSTPIEHMSLGGAHDLLMRLFMEWGIENENAAEKEWQNAESVVPSSKVTIEPMTVKTLDASIFGVPVGTALTFENIVPAIDSVSQNLVESVNRTASAIGKSVTDAMDSGLSEIAHGVQQRLSLLWWKQTLYSPSQQTGYRVIPSSESRIFALAYDLYKQLPNTYPKSVEYLLRETVADVAGDWQDSISAFSTSAISDQSVASILKLLCKAQIGRTPLLTFLSAAARGEVQTTNAAAIVGIQDDTKLSGADLAVWLLRELTADYLATPE